MKRKILLGLISLFIPGFGQVLNSQIIKGLTVFLIPFVTWAAFRFLQVEINFYWLYALVLLGIAIRIYAAVDSIQNSKPRADRISVPLYYSWGAGLTMLAIVLTVSSDKVLNVDTFSLDNPTMFPTFLSGDKVVCYKNIESLNYGDVAAFEVKGLGLWSYRIIGLPNDTIEVLNHEIKINGMTLAKEFIENGYENGVETNIYFETDLLKNRYMIQEYEARSNPDINKTTILNEDQYFMLGDNRDNAQDSRYLGPIEKESIYGTIEYVYWNNDLTRLNAKF